MAELPVVMKSWLPAQRGRSISVTHFWSMLLKSIEEAIRDSWLSRLSFPLNHWTWTELMPRTTRLSNWPSGEDWDWTSSEQKGHHDERR